MQNFLSNFLFRIGFGGSSQILGTIIRLFLNLFLARVLGVAGYGYFVIYQAIGRIIILFGISGIESFISLTFTRYVEGKSFNKAKKLIRYCIIHLCIFSIVIGVLFIILLNHDFNNISNVNKELVTIAIFAAFLNGLSRLSSSLLMASEKFFSALLPHKIIEPLIFIAIMALFVYFGFDLNVKIALISWLISSLIIMIYLSCIAIKTLLSYPKSDKSYDVKEDSWFKILAPLSLNDFIIQGRVSISDIIIGAILSAESVGLIRVAKTISGLLSAVKTSLEPILRPYAAKLWVNEKKYLISRNLSKLTRIISTFDFITLIILFFLGESILVFLFGEEYQPASDILRILILGIFLGGIWGFGNLILTMTGFGIVAVKAQFIVAILYMLILILATLNFGLMGASVVFMLFELMTRFIMYSLAARKTNINTSIFNRQ